jgi:hypothetical protein
MSSLEEEKKEKDDIEGEVEEVRRQFKKDDLKDIFNNFKRNIDSDVDPVQELTGVLQILNYVLEDPNYFASDQEASTYFNHDFSPDLLRNLLSFTFIHDDQVIKTNPINKF